MILDGGSGPVSYTHLDVYKRQVTIEGVSHEMWLPVLDGFMAILRLASCFLKVRVLGLLFAFYFYFERTSRSDS